MARKEKRTTDVNAFGLRYKSAGQEPPKPHIFDRESAALAKTRVRKAAKTIKKRKPADERDKATKNKKAPANPYRAARAFLADREGYPFAGKRPPTCQRREPVKVDAALRSRAERLGRID